MLPVYLFDLQTLALRQATKEKGVERLQVFPISLSCLSHAFSLYTIILPSDSTFPKQAQYLP